MIPLTNEKASTREENHFEHVMEQCPGCLGQVERTFESGESVFHSQPNHLVISLTSGLQPQHGVTIANSALLEDSMEDCVHRTNS